MRLLGSRRLGVFFEQLVLHYSKKFLNFKGYIAFMLFPTPTLAASKPEAEDPLRLSFFYLLGLVLRFSAFTSLGVSCAFLCFLFKAPKQVEVMPLLQEKGYIYWVHDKKPLTRAWIQKRKSLFEEESAKVRLTTLDLNSWAAKAFPPGPLNRGKHLQAPGLKLLQKVVRLERPFPPSFYIQPEGILLSQPLTLYIGQNLALPLFAQALLQPEKKKGAFYLSLQGLSLGWLKLSSKQLKAFSSGSCLQLLYPGNKEMKALSYLLDHLLDLHLAQGELLLIRKASF